MKKQEFVDAVNKAIDNGEWPNAEIINKYAPKHKRIANLSGREVTLRDKICQQRAIAKPNHNEDRVKKAVNDLIDEGIYPSDNSVCKRLTGIEGQLSPTSRRWRREVMAERNIPIRNSRVPDEVLRGAGLK